MSRAEHCTEALRPEAPRYLFGIRAKVALATAAVFTSAILLQALMVVMAQKRQIEHLHGERVGLLAQSVRGTVLNTMLEQRQRELPSILRAFGMHNTHSAAEIRSHLGMVVASSLEGRTGRFDPVVLNVRFQGPYEVQDSLFGNAATTRVEPLLNRGACAECHEGTTHPIGYLLISVSRKQIDARAKELRNSMVGSSAVVLVLLFGATWFALSRLVVQPIRTMASSMSVARSGNLSVRVPDDDQEDEIGWLAHSFNDMINELSVARRQLEESYRERLERADRFATVGHLASGLAHEIKNPLAGLSGACQILVEEFPDDEEKRDVVIEMQRQIDRLNRAMNDLLRFARPAPPEPAAIDINAVLDHVVALISKQKSAQNIEVDVWLEAKHLIYADGGQLEQVFLNLCLNSLQAIPQGGTLRVSSRDDEGSVVVELADSGPGIPVEIRDKVFTPFFTTKTEGTGLGLAISKRIVRQNLGELSFDCPAEGGTRFLVRLPRHLPEERDEQA